MGQSPQLSVERSSTTPYANPRAMPFTSTRMLQLRRITTRKRFIPQIDGLRFVAIASEVFFHIYAALEIGAIPPPSLSTPTSSNAAWKFLRHQRLHPGVPAPPDPAPGHHAGPGFLSTPLYRSMHLHSSILILCGLFPCRLLKFATFI